MAGCGAIPGLICLVENFDKKSRVCFHKGMGAVALQKSLMHGLVHLQSYMNC